MKNLLSWIILLVFVFTQCFGQNTSTVMKTQQNFDWNTISEVSGRMNVIYFVDSTNGWIAGDSGRIYVTDNGGIKWLSQNSGTENKLVSIYFMNDQTGFASGYNRTLLRTNDGGDTWTTVKVSGDSGLIFSSLGPGTADSLFFISNFGEIHYSNDSGVSWPKSYSFNQYGFSYLDCTNGSACFAMQVLLKYFYKSTDGGKVWERLSAPIQYSGDIYFLNSSTGWISEDWIFSSSWHDSVSIYITTDGGKTWMLQSSLEGKSLTNIVFTDTFEGWLSGYGGTKIYYSPDSGKSWNCQFECDSLDWIKNIYFLNNVNGWALTSKGKILKYGVPVVSTDESVNIYNGKYILNQNYPNPFNPSTRISYSIAKPDYVTVKIYDLLGREVLTLVNEFQRAGNHVVNFNADKLSSGIYFYKFQAGNNYTIVKKMLLLK